MLSAEDTRELIDYLKHEYDEHKRQRTKDTEDSLHLEYAKNVVEFIKHLTTLSTGAIVLQIAFLEKVFPHPHWKAFIAVSLLSFTLSIVASGVAYTTLLPAGRSRWLFGPITTGEMVGLFGIWVSLLGVLLGILNLVIFALKNLFTL